jgi:hypothetical protein
MNNKRKPRRPATGGGAFGNGPGGPRKKGTGARTSQAFADNFAAAVLRGGGEVHRVPDGEGGVYQISIINPGAIRPANREGSN